MAISQRSASQREVNELLQRKHAWSSNDLERFTALYRSDHANEQAESSAQDSLVAAERQAEEAAAKLSASILARYHEEQIWSDKIRRMSTWGTWGLMGVNVLLFLVFQIGVEPWRRKRLVKGFEDKVMEALEREGPIGASKPTTVPTFETPTPTSPPPTELALEATHQNTPPPPLSTTTNLSQHEDTTIPTRETHTATLPSENPAIGSTKSEILPTPPEKTPSTLDLSTPPTTSFLISLTPKTALVALKDALRDLFSARPVLVRRVDLTTIALEGAAAGMALVGLVAMLFLRVSR